MIPSQYSSLVARIIASKQEHIIKVLNTLPQERRVEYISSFEQHDFEMIDAVTQIIIHV
jgi:hypothetical protein